MATIKITGNGAITLPSKFRKALDLKAGDFVNAEMAEGRIIIKPARVIDAEDAWFHTRSWQEGEAAVDEELRQGDALGPFDDVRKAIQALHSKKRP